VDAIAAHTRIIDSDVRSDRRIDLLMQTIDCIPLEVACDRVEKLTITSLCDHYFPRDIIQHSLVFLTHNRAKLPLNSYAQRPLEET
jgi:hypothetical protein